MRTALPNSSSSQTRTVGPQSASFGCGRVAEDEGTILGGGAVQRVPSLCRDAMRPVAGMGANDWRGRGSGAQRGAGMRRDDRALVLEDDLGVQGGGGAIPCNIKRSEGSPFVIIKRGRGQSLVNEKEARAIPCRRKSNCSQWGLTLCAAYGLYTGAAALQPPPVRLLVSLAPRGFSRRCPP